MNRFTLLFFAVLSMISCNRKNLAEKKSVFVIDELKCEYAKEPINIDIEYPTFSWVIPSKLNGQKQKAYQITVSKNKDFTKLIWDSGKVNSSDSGPIIYAGQNLKSNTSYFWKVLVWDSEDRIHESEIAGFATAFLHPNEWKAKWISAKSKPEASLPNGFLKSVKEQQTLSDTIIHNGRSLLLRNEFECKSNIKSARVFVTGLGYYELYLNGNRVGDHVLSPAKTNYAKEILYDTYDITEQLKNGKNVFGIHLGNGWFNPYKKWWEEYRMQWFGAKRAILQLEIIYKNGEKDLIITNENWKYKQGPILYNCVYDGELYDATQESVGWSDVNYVDVDWKNVNIAESSKKVLRSQTMQAVKVVQKINSVKVTNPKPGVLIYDMGQNFAGWAKITVKGKMGTRLHLQFAEDLHKDGTIDITSNENAKAEATYILKGKGVETYEPRFTFYGFRYVEVTADADLPEIKKMEGCVVHSANAQTGYFECGNKTINKIHHATVWSQKSNMLGYPMDCPQRDERLGWMGDAQVTVEEAMFNFDMARFYGNWITGIRKNQHNETGDIPIISPRPYIRDEGVEWSSTYINLIWKYYVFYGDKRILKENYNAMKKFMKFLDGESVDLILKQGWIGDWGSLVKGWEEGEPESVPTAFYFWNSKILSKIAKVLGEDKDVEYFSLKAENIKNAYNKKYFNLDKMEYNKGSQMANAFPLFLGIVPDIYKKEVLKNLVDDIINKNNGHITTGVLGSKYMIDVLSMEGRADVAYLLATQTGYPSWSDMVKNRTTMSEFWTLKQSHNHVMTGSIDAFFYKTLAGINPNEKYPGFERVIIKPYIPETLPYVNASVETIKGKVEVSWKNDKTELNLKIKIPANMLADVYIPVNKSLDDTISDDFSDKKSGVSFVDGTDRYLHYHIESGIYSFKVHHQTQPKEN